MSEATTGVIRILAADDHPLIREGIARLIERESDMQMVAEADNGRDAIRQFRAHRPDITLMDLQMPEMSGLDAIIAIRSEFSNARIIVLTTYPGDAQALRALQAGAKAYLLKTTLNTELRQSIRAVYAGRKSLSTEISFQLAEHATDDALTTVETRVLRLVAAGNANKEIAAQLSVSEETVKGQVSRILSKLGANDRTHAVVIGLQRGIIEL
jgi:DNA-binding NarL/FixJ family response regulator